nr:MAG TPA: chromosome partitioning protein [Caudoviricetes sp.]
MGRRDYGGTVMAKKFNLAELMGEAVSKSDTGEMQVEQIPLTEIEENENNSYAQTGIDELAESIKVIGLQQPLVVRRKTEGGYLLLAGHRRRNALALLDRKTAPCIVLDADLDPSIQTLILHWTNTMARGGGGLTAQYTAAAAKEIEAALKDLQPAAWSSCRASCAVMLPRCSKRPRARSPGQRQSTTG